MKQIAVSTRVVEADGYNESRDALAWDWCSFFTTMGYLPIMIPNNLSLVDKYLEELAIDGIILTGGNTVGVDGEELPPKDVKPRRDKTESALISWAIQHSIPLLGTCRGMQMINRYFGGNITRDLASLDELQDEHVGCDHEIELVSEEWQTLAGAKHIKVNSFHNDGIMVEDVSERLTPLARSLDGILVEGINVPGKPIYGIGWHIERASPSGNFDQALVGSIFGK